jgi:putative hydrolase of the HAD superfamily
MTKAIFFDVWDVLITEGFAKGIVEYETEQGIAPGKLYIACHDKPYWKNFSLGNIPEQEYFKNINTDFNNSLNIERLRKKIFQKSVPNIALLDFLKTLKSKYTLGVISNNPKEWFDFFWEKCKLKKIFSVKAVSGYVHIRKPDVRIYEYALDEAKVSGTESIYVDNRADRVSGAKEAGMKILIYQNLEQLKKDLNNLK